MLAINDSLLPNAPPKALTELSAVQAVAQSCRNHAYDSSSPVSCVKISVNINRTYPSELIVSV
jgi:hypothetical protein